MNRVERRPVVYWNNAGYDPGQGRQDEFCAAGLPVVATRIAECVRAPLVEVAADAGEFAAVVQRVLDAERDVASALAAASANTWAARAEALDAYLLAYDHAGGGRCPAAPTVAPGAVPLAGSIR